MRNDSGWEQDGDSKCGDSKSFHNTSKLGSAGFPKGKDMRYEKRRKVEGLPGDSVG